MSVLMRPRPDGPIYEARLKRDGSGWLLVPYYAEPDGATEVTTEQVYDFRLTTRRCGGLVFGGRDDQ
jgi:hypothetical protein